MGEQPTKVYIGANLRFRDERLFKAVKGHLTHQNPAHKNTWNGKPSKAPQYLYFYSHHDGSTEIPRGTWTLLEDVADEIGIELELVDQRRRFKADTCEPEDLSGIVPREYQLFGIKEMIKSTEGVVVMPCGGGKTIQGASAIVASGQPALVLVHQKDLLDQWVEAFELLTHDTPRIISGGSADLSPLKPGEVAIAMVQLLARRPAEDTQPLLDSAGAVLLDEAHHAPASQFDYILGRCSAFYRWGLTATLERSDEMEFVLDLIFGGVIHEVKHAELIRDGYIVPPVVVPIETRWSPPASCRRYDGKLDYTKTLTALSLNTGRLQLIANIVEAAYEDGRTTLVLVGRVAAAEIVVGLIRDRGISCASLIGKDKKESRATRLQQLRDGALDVLVATQLADEGLNIPSLDCMVLGGAGRAKGKAQQRVGRSARPGTRAAVVFDLVDDDEFQHQWRSRRTAYVDAYDIECLLSWDEIPIGDALHGLSECKIMAVAPQVSSVSKNS